MLPVNFPEMSSPLNFYSILSGGTILLTGEEFDRVLAKQKPVKNGAISDHKWVVGTTSPETGCQEPCATTGPQPHFFIFILPNTSVTTVAQIATTSGNHTAERTKRLKANGPQTVGSWTVGSRRVGPRC